MRSEMCIRDRCGDILEKLPDGIDTQIGTEGTYLSGGEQQRIALARAILKDAQMCIRDSNWTVFSPDCKSVSVILVRLS